jgi:hypothetical protein
LTHQHVAALKSERFELGAKCVSLGRSEICEDVKTLKAVGWRRLHARTSLPVEKYLIIARKFLRVDGVDTGVVMPVDQQEKLANVIKRRLVGRVFIIASVETSLLASSAAATLAIRPVASHVVS